MTGMTLKEWTKAYVKYKDLIPRKIESVEEIKEGLSIKYKTGEATTYICTESLESLKTGDTGNKKVVCLNTRKNLDWLVRNWDAVKGQGQVFIFVNLDKAESWAINPYLHSNVTEKKSLKQGLKALFDSVPEASP
jgi:hypothetical protein